MYLTVKTVSKSNGDYKEIKQLMKRGFPREELFPMFLLLWVARMKNVEFLSFYDENTLVGLLYTVDCKENLHLKYLVVNDAVQGKGYGSEMLTWLKEKYGGKTITLFIETLNEKVKNIEQRKKRLRFYERNGFYPSGYSAGMKEVMVDILSSSPTFSKDNCKNLLRFLPFRLMPKQR